MKKLVIAVALSAAFVAAPAAAQSYVGGGIGRSDTDTGENSWKVYGGYQFSPTWGVEGAYTDLGKYRTEDVESWSLAGTATLPMGQRWHLLAKLGVARNNADASSDKKSSTLVGVGVGVAMSPTFGLRLEYEDYGKMGVTGLGTENKASNVSLSAKFSF
jgi:OOP family OmpA-OmpF porin